METKIILVTGIGGNVGQGIIRNIRQSHYNCTIIGTNISAMSAGNHLVDIFYEVPYSYDPDYITVMKSIVLNNKVDLIIPSTDFEIYYLSIHESEFTCKIACSGPKSSEIYLDKYQTFLHHNSYQIPFSASCLPSKFVRQFSPAIAKPRKGRGSRGIIKYVTQTDNLSDEEYLIQEMGVGEEITTAVYCSYQTRKLVGLVTMVRSLENGATTYCKVVKDYDEELEKIAISIIEKSDIKGAFNIQSIVKETGEIMPFEINCRISGTNSIRSQFGFQDVIYTIEELLYNKEIKKPEVSCGVAYRYLADVIYPNGVDNGNSSDNYILF